jgi:hypothetical protein
MRHVFGILAVLSLPFGASAGLAQEATATPELPIVDSAEVALDDFLWVKRPIVVFAAATADPRFVEQMRFLEADVEELLLRDVVILTDTDPKAKSTLRKKLRPRGFMLALIDKDGGIKLRKPAPWTVREITRSIDKWPTRQQEIRVELGKE